MSRVSRLLKTSAALYQVAGHLLLSPQTLTEGQRERLEQLILDVLADPEDYTAGVVRDLRDMALKP